MPFSPPLRKTNPKRVASPVTIECLLRAYYSGEPEPHSNMSISVRDSYSMLERSNCVEWDEKLNRYIATERGKAWAKMLLETPMPVPSTGYRDPRNGEEIVV